MDGLLYKYLLIKFAKYKMIQVLNNKNYIDFIFRIDTYTLSKNLLLDNNNNKKLPYNVNSILTNLLMNSEILGNKQKLYFEMLKYNPKITEKYFAKTYLLKDINSIDSVNIVRSFNKYTSGSGKNIYIVETTKELNELKKKVNINDFIISEYIINPLLFKNKKFHLRVLFMIKYINNEITFSIFKNITILQAKLPFINNDYLNKDIHDTHLKSTDDDYFFYNEFKNNKNYNNIIKQIKTVIKECINMAKLKIKPYPESKNAFQTYMCDFMITADYNIKLLEINTGAIGYKFLNIKNHDMETLYSKNYFGWIFQKTIVPIFFPKLLLFDNNIKITNKYYDIIKDNNILTIKLNIKYDDILIYYIIMINLLCPYMEIADITILDLTINNLWKSACENIKCNYIIIDKKYDLIICNNLNDVKDFKKYIIIEEFLEHKFYKGLIKFNNKNFYIYKK